MSHRVLRPLEHRAPRPFERLAVAAEVQMRRRSDEEDTVEMRIARAEPPRLLEGGDRFILQAEGATGITEPELGTCIVAIEPDLALEQLHRLLGAPGQRERRTAHADYTRICRIQLEGLL